METVNLSSVDELVIRPTGAATVRYEFETEATVDVHVRDAIKFRDEQIEALRGRLAEIENADYADRRKLAEAVVDEIVRRLGG